MKKIVFLVKSRVVLVASLTLGIAASWGCSSDSSGTPSTKTEPESVTVSVSAADGGTVADKANKVSLKIPGGALAEDTDITLDVSSAANGSAGPVYEFGPDGLEFSAPALLEVKAGGITVPKDKSLALGLFDGTSFKAVEGSTYADGVVTAPIAHFTKYAIILIDGKVVLEPPANCKAAIDGFKACGGDITGTWTFADFCVDAKALTSDPFDGACPEFVAAVEFTSDRQITFKDGTQTTTAGTETTVLTYSFPLSCATAKDKIASCADVGDDSTACTESKTGICDCVQTNTKQKEANSDSYTINGDSFASGTDAPFDYCVNGDLLSAQGADSDSGVEVTYVLKRK